MLRRHHPLIHPTPARQCWRRRTLCKPIPQRSILCCELCIAVHTRVIVFKATAVRCLIPATANKLPQDEKPGCPSPFLPGGPHEGWSKRHAVALAISCADMPRAEFQGYVGGAEIKAAVDGRLPGSGSIMHATTWHVCVCFVCARAPACMHASCELCTSVFGLLE